MVEFVLFLARGSIWFLVCVSWYKVRVFEVVGWLASCLVIWKHLRCKEASLVS